MLWTNKKDEGNPLGVYIIHPAGLHERLKPCTEKSDTPLEHFIKAHRRIRNKEEEFIKPVEEDTCRHWDYLSRYWIRIPINLSGGMKAKGNCGACHRAAAADYYSQYEPTTALDKLVMQRGVIQLLKDVQSSLKNTIIMVTHDMGIHANIADRIGIMHAGKMIEEASTEEIFGNPLHPYTQYLIGSLPVIGIRATRRALPEYCLSLINPPEGCRFYPRCDRATDEL